MCVPREKGSLEKEKTRAGIFSEPREGVCLLVSAAIFGDPRGEVDLASIRRFGEE